MNHDNRPNHNPQLDPSLRAIEDALDALGAAERARAHGALEQDILRATRAVRAGTPAHRESLFARFAPSMRIGAAVAIVAVMAMVTYVGVRSSTTTSHQFAQVERALDSFLTTTDAGAETADTTLVLGDAALVDIKASIAAAEESLDDFWAVPDDTIDPLGSDLENSL